MKDLRHNQPNHIGCVLLATGLTLLSGCAEWSGNPARVQSNYGASVRNMVNEQIYNQNKAQYPAGLLPSGIEGDKAITILEGRTYRGDTGNPDNIGHSQLGNPGISGSGGSGGSTR